MACTSCSWSATSRVAPSSRRFPIAGCLSGTRTRHAIETILPRGGRAAVRGRFRRCPARLRLVRACCCDPAVGGGRLRTVPATSRRTERQVSPRSDWIGPYLWLAVHLLYPLTRLLFKVRWYGLDRIPKSGGAIVAV